MRVGSLDFLASLPVCSLERSGLVVFANHWMSSLEFSCSSVELFFLIASRLLFDCFSIVCRLCLGCLGLVYRCVLTLYWFVLPNALFSDRSCARKSFVVRHSEVCLLY